MAASGQITVGINPSPLIFTDTSSALPTITERILEVYGPTGALLTTIDMGASLTAEYPITQDQWLSFKLILNGGDFTADVDYLSEGFYYKALINQSKSGCGCKGNALCSDTAKAMLADKAALFYTAYGMAVNADTSIKASNAYIL